MERTASLIKRLQELHESRASVKSLLATAQMLVQELSEQSDSDITISKTVSVILPVANFVQSEPVTEKELEKNNDAHTPVPSISVTEEPVFQPEKAKEEKPKPGVPPFPLFPRLEEIPTFAYQQKDVNELNDAAEFKQSSLNERLKNDKRELGSILKETPVKDLRKAIGINDRFVFISELFRGDEDMYERSIKTINSFSILPEAEYWIQRELKIKIGWNEDSETVRHFDQLVRRRFA